MVFPPGLYWIISTVLIIWDLHTYTNTSYFALFWPNLTPSHASLWKVRMCSMRKQTYILGWSENCKNSNIICGSIWKVRYDQYEAREYILFVGWWVIELPQNPSKFSMNGPFLLKIAISFYLCIFSQIWAHFYKANFSLPSYWSYLTFQIDPQIIF